MMKINKILLTQLPTSSFTSEKVYPLGLSRLSSLVPDSMQKMGLDMNLSPDPYPELVEKLQSFTPDIIAFSFRNMDPLAGIHSSYFHTLKTCVNLARKLCPKARIICGGPGFSLFAYEIIQALPNINYGIKGEAEEGFPLLLKTNVDPKTLGLVFNNDGEICVNPSSHSNLNGIPPLDTQIFPPPNYLDKNGYVAAMGVEGKRGCSLRCGYCTYPTLGGKKARLRKPTKVVDDIEECMSHGAKIIHFTDSVVNRPASHLQDICTEIINRKLDIKWTGFFREDQLTEDLAKLAVQSGIVTFYFSGDSLTEYGLNLLNKNLSKEDLFNAAKITAKTGIITCYHFMANLPGETDTHHQEAMETIEKIYDIHKETGNLGAVILSTIRLYPHSPLTIKLQNEGLLENVNLLFPTYYNPPETSHRLHELTAFCHERGIRDHLKI